MKEFEETKQKVVFSCDECTNLSVQRGVCKRGMERQSNFASVSSEGCTNQAQIGGVCKRHVVHRGCALELERV